jgi:hypothetical protein
MQQEARNTETHTRDWQSSTLRKNPVKFVKAGELQRSEFETVDQADQESEGQAGDDAKESSPAVVSPPEPTQDNTEFGFFFDATPQTVTDTGLPDPIIRTQLSDFDDSSEDEVVFTGRKTGTRPIVIETSKEELREFLHAPQTVLSTTQHKSTAADAPATRNPRSEPSQNREQPHTQDTRKWTREDEDNMLADYIANMDTDYQEDIISHMQVELEGGIDVAQAAADSKSSAHGQDEADESLTQLDPTRPECVLKEAQVQSSIDGKCTRIGVGSHTILTWKT